jgi:hypothetical protein
MPQVEKRERRPLRVVNAYVMALILAELEQSRAEGYRADELARHLWRAGRTFLAGKPATARETAEVLHAWAHLLEADARALEGLSSSSYR